MTTPHPAELVPHAGSMCLLEQVLSWDDSTVVAITKNHTDLQHPLRSGGRLAMVHLCEYGAQAMAVHGGLLAARDGQRAAPGLLVSLRDVTLVGGDLSLAGPTLQITANRLHGDSTGWQYAFKAEAGGRLLGEGRAAVVLRQAG